MSSVFVREGISFRIVHNPYSTISSPKTQKKRELISLPYSFPEVFFHGGSFCRDNGFFESHHLEDPEDTDHDESILVPMMRGHELTDLATEIHDQDEE